MFDRSATRRVVEGVILQLVLDRRIRVAPRNVPALERNLDYPVRKAVDLEEDFRLWSRPSRRPRDAELEAFRQRRLTELRRAGVGRGVLSVADAMLEALRARREVTSLADVIALRETILATMARLNRSPASTPSDDPGFPPPSGHGSGGGTPAEARVSDTPPDPRSAEPDLDRRERKIREPADDDE
jgi:hypothetical protein